MKYVGKGAWLPGIPARDLSDDEAQRFGEKRLLDSGLYEKERKQPAKAEKEEGDA